MSGDKSLPLGPVFALDTLRNRVNTTIKINQNRNNTQQGDYPIIGLPQNSFMFFRGIRLLPPRAGITAIRIQYIF